MDTNSVPSGTIYFPKYVYKAHQPPVAKLTTTKAQLATQMSRPSVSASLYYKTPNQGCTSTKIHVGVL